MNLIFWHNIISPHQSAVMRCLALSGHDITLVSSEEMSEDRRKLGWKIPSIDPAHLIYCSDKDSIEMLVGASRPDTIHIIAGARATPLGKYIAKSCLTIGRRVGIITESPDPRGVGGIARFLKYSFENKFIGAHFDFVLAMGELGVNWFNHCGYAGRCFPYAYVTENSYGTPIIVKNNDKFRVLYVGQLIHRKGVDILLRAFSYVPNVELHVIGNGEDEQLFKNLASELSLNERVVWVGQLPDDQVRTYMQSSDILVLPSRHDGWGAVVNEALMAGTPVICSSACGASDLIQYPWLGSVFKKSDIDDLQRLLLHWARQKVENGNDRLRIKEWSECIEGERVASYLLAILNSVYHGGECPTPPWRIKQ